MPTQNQDLRYRLLGEDVSAGRTFSKVAQEAKSAHAAISTLGQSLNAAGTFTPLMQGVDAVSQAFQHVQENGKRASVVMQGVGIGIVGLGAAFLAVGAKEQQAAAGLKQSIEAAGGSFADYRQAINETIDQQEKFGHSANDTQDALSRLVQATNDPTQAINLMGLAANVAAARHISLTDAATTLAQGLAGNTRGFRQFGITLDGVGSKSEQVNRAFTELEQKLSGQAQAQADTFSGKLRAMGVHFEDLVASMSKFTPVLFAVGSAMTVVGAATDMLNKKRMEQAGVDALLIRSENGVASAEVRVSAASAAAARKITTGMPSLQEASLAEDAGLIGGGAALGLGSRLLRGGAFAGGGLIAGQVASGLIGGKTGSALGGVATGAGLGAGVGLIGGPLDFISVPVGAGVGALVGGVAGLFGGGHHGPSKAQQQANLKQILANLDRRQTQQADTQIAGTLPGEFDVQGVPKAKKVADATESLAKAKLRLTRAQEDLNKATAKGTDPAKLTAAEAHLTAAQANLEKALYIGGDARIASAQAVVASATAHVNALHAGVDTTSQQRRVADAKQAVTDAQRRLADVKGPPLLTAQDLLKRLTGNTGTERGLAADQAKLVRFGLTQQFLTEADALEKQAPGTMHKLAQTMTRSIAEQINKQEDQYNQAAQNFVNAFNRAAKKPAEALGAQLATDVLNSFNGKIRELATEGGKGFGPGSAGPPTAPTPIAGVQAGAATRGGTQTLGGVYVHNVNVTAQRPQQLAQSLTDLARHKSLGIPTNAAP